MSRRKRPRTATRAQLDQFARSLNASETVVAEDDSRRCALCQNVAMPRHPGALRPTVVGWIRRSPLCRSCFKLLSENRQRGFYGEADTSHRARGLRG